jgi:F0F1-type ATP synthase membrane subunit c/vacuolar-type H+-ATPase subunit K
MIAGIFEQPESVQNMQLFFIGLSAFTGLFSVVAAFLRGAFGEDQ